MCLADTGDLAPEESLRLPAGGFVERVEPGRHVLDAVEAEAGDVEVETGIAREIEQAAQSLQCLRAHLVRRGHVGGQLQMHPNDVCSERFHLSEVMFDVGPLFGPVFLKHGAELAEVIEAPGRETLTGVLKHKVSPIGANADGFERLRLDREEECDEEGAGHGVGWGEFKKCPFETDQPGRE